MAGRKTCSGDFLSSFPGSLFFPSPPPLFLAPGRGRREALEMEVGDLLVTSPAP